MKNTDIAQQIARETGLTQGEAADRLDEVITSILKNLKKGRTADLPGLGRLRRDLRGTLQFSRTPPRSSHESR